jgi:ATP-dependent Clp protease ATP-binding subunit ClpA
MPINQTANISNALIEAYGIASEKRNEFITPEHLLAGFLKDSDFWEVLGRCGRAEELEKNLYEYINGLDRIPEDHELSIEFSAQLQELFEKAGETAASAMAQVVQTHHLIFSIFHLEESYARYHLESCLECSIPDFLNSLLEFSEAEVPEGMEPWRKYFKELESIGEYVGKKEEIQKIFRTLCRHKKANVLIVGDRGVGKTAMACEIARLLQDKSAWKNDVPEKLHNMSLMELDVPLLLGGTQYRGDLEMRVKEIMERVSEEGDPIIYNDLRTLGGNSRNDDGSKDILNLLIPYLKSSNIRCIISCTYEDIKKVENINSGALSLFQRIELKEPDADETFEIIKHNTLAQLETSHKTKYSETICRFAIEKSMRFISDRCLPEKAIDLLDQAGAYCETKRQKKVSETSVMTALKDICREDISTSASNGNLSTLEEGLKTRIYGQDQAIQKLTECILMSKAGLLDRDKTIGSFLFVGPTGVGKTELSKVLAQQLNVPLHRFDMSEYSEKHSVAKLIGSPAGYVGYDDGGILTDTIRKNPYCVLLLDEIEKAHEDIYNLLLQVMDYAVISDNKGRKVDFRNVVLIMTSNAGARYAHKASVGFERKVNAGEAMAKEVKNVFAPEFINRLSSVVVFNDMDEKMAGLILDDKIRKLQERLDSKKIKLQIQPEAYAALLKEGFSPEYGAREIERVLNARLTPLLMKEILFGGHGEGFTAIVTITPEGLAIGCSK